jgi:hypothetical protein
LLGFVFLFGICVTFVSAFGVVGAWHAESSLLSRRRNWYLLFYMILVIFIIVAEIIIAISVFQLVRTSSQESFEHQSSVMFDFNHLSGVQVELLVFPTRMPTRLLFHLPVGKIPLSEHSRLIEKPNGSKFKKNSNVVVCPLV